MADSDRTTSAGRSASRWFARMESRPNSPVPGFVNDSADLRDIAVVAIGALEKWEGVKGLGA
jgi:hypothetical protein